MARVEFTLEIHEDTDGMLWGEVQELPGCFASGADMDELLEAAREAIELYRTPSERTDDVVSLAERRAIREKARVHRTPKALVLEG